MALTWTEKRTTDYYVSIACSADGTKILAASSGARLWLSTDSGANWTEQRPGGDNDLNWRKVTMDSDGSVLLATESTNNNCYISTNGGTNWAEMGQSFGAYALCCDDDGSVIIIGNYGGRMWRSTNSGTSWAEIYPYGTSNQNYIGVSCDSDGSVIFVGTGANGIRWSTDSGANWGSSSGGNSATDCFKVDADGSVMFFATYNARVWKSVNSGTDWSEVRPIDNGDYAWANLALSRTDGSVMFANPSYTPQRLYRSTDTGANWVEEQPAGATNATWKICCSADGAIAYAADNGGKLYRGAVAVGPANLKSYNTNLKANIKSINTNLIANVKTLNTNA